MGPLAVRARAARRCQRRGAGKAASAAGAVLLALADAPAALAITELYSDPRTQVTTGHTLSSPY